MFSDLISRTMEVCVDNMLLKSLKAANHTEHLEEAFEILRMYWMKLNPLKWAFGIASGKILG